MARVFRHSYTKQGRGGRRVTVQTRKWYVEYRDPSGTKHRVAATPTGRSRRGLP